MAKSKNKIPRMDTKEFAKVIPPELQEKFSKHYQRNILSKLHRAKENRDQVNEYFDYKTYTQSYHDNIKKASTILPQAKDGDVIVSAGTLESKLFALSSETNRLNMSAEIQAFDKDENLLTQAAQAMEDVHFRVNTINKDKEKRQLRHFELMMQGTIFVQTKWQIEYKKKKNFKGKFTGQFEGAEWTEKLEKSFEGPRRKILYGPNVVLGSMSVYHMEEQPFWFYIDVQPKSETAKVFGKWENYEYTKGIGRTDLGEGTDKLGRWTINDTRDDEDEIIYFEDRQNNVAQIIINGIPMLPEGFPLEVFVPAGEYSVVKQVFRPISPFFPYGRSFIQTAQRPAALLDEMLRLGVLKTRRSFDPPWVNRTKRYISPRVLQSGKISMGFDPSDLLPLGDRSEGMSPSEFQMINHMGEKIDRMTVSPQFAGQSGKSGTTATESLYLKERAEATIGLVLFVIGLLEEKLAEAQHYILLENYFKPIDKKVVGDKTINRFRSTSRKANIDGAGQGQRDIVVTDQKLPTSSEVRAMELYEEEMLGYPVEKIFLNPDQLKNSVKYWYFTVVPKQEETSDFAKLSFREELADLAVMQSFGSQPSVDGIEDKFARVYGVDRAKMFTDRPPANEQELEEDLAAVANDPNGGRANIKGVPTKANVKTAI